MNKPGWAPVKLNQTDIENYGWSTYMDSSWGPIFGNGEMAISDNASSNVESTASIGTIYSAPCGPAPFRYSATPYNRFSQTFLAGRHVVTPDEVETFYETN